MADPVMIAVATALATNAVDGLSRAGRSAFAALARLVRRKLADRPEATSALATAQDRPGSEAGIADLAAALAAASAQDASFADDVRRLWGTVTVDRTVACDGGVVNHVSGPVSGTLLQARDVHGGVSFGAATARPDDG